MTNNASIRMTENFLASLESIKPFYQQSNAIKFFDHLMEDLFEFVMPNLEQLPKLGFDFLE